MPTRRSSPATPQRRFSPRAPARGSGVHLPVGRFNPPAGPPAHPGTGVPPLPGPPLPGPPLPGPPLPGPPLPGLPLRPRVPHRTGRVPTGTLAVVLLVVGCLAVAAGVAQVAAGLRLPELFGPPDEPPPRAFPVLEPSRPNRLLIPSLRVEAPVFGVGLADDGSIDVPPVNRHNEAGWFTDGPTPGQFGPAVIVGHADTRTGPSVFHDLPRLRPGARVEVVRRDGRVAVFEVNSVERFAKSAVPVDRVYGDYSRPSLRLITCGGRWVGGRTGYADNIVVFASLVHTRRG